MLPLLLSLALAKSVPSPPPPPPPVVKPAGRSAALIQEEIAALEAQLDEVKPLRSWIPMVIGAAGAGVSAITALVLLFSAVSAPGLIIGALVFVGLAVVSLAVGVSIGIGMQFANASRSSKASELRARILLLREELRRTNTSLAPWNGGVADASLLVPVFTF